MFSFLRQTFCQWARTGTRPGAQPKAVRRLECETLEDRMLLSLTGAQLFASSLPAADHAATASAPDGRSVAVWQQPSGHNGFTDLHAQRFDATGHKVGGEILVAGDLQDQYDPAVAMNASGQFVVAWTLQFSTTDTDVHATLFNADGTVKAGDFGVATSWKREFDASAGIAADGSFDISYTLQFNSSDQDVHAAMFDAGAHELRDLGVAVSTRVENNAHVTEAANGQFAVSYLVGGLSAVKYYSSSGQPLESGQGIPSPPPPTPPPPPPAPPILTGTVAGGYAAGPGGANHAPGCDLVAIGNLAKLGETTVTGELFGTGSLRSSEATGVLTLHDALGTVTLSLVGPAQGPYAALPAQFHFTVTSCTGAFAHLHASGIALLRLFPSSHTLTLNLHTTGA